MDSELTFRGTSAEECEDFVRALLRQGHADGKLQDDKYMAEVAALSFAGPALRWYARLDRNIKASWDQLLVALLDQYTDSDNAPFLPSPSMLGNAIPTPAAAVPTTSLGRPSVPFDIPGRIRILANDPLAGKYVSAKLDANFGMCITCNDPSEALVVRSTPGQPTTPGHRRLRSFTVLNPAERSLPGLGVILEKLNSTFRVPKNRYAQMVLMSVDGSQVRTTYDGEGTVKSAVWDCSYHDGEVRAIWETEDGAYLLSTAVNVENKRILLANNFDAFCVDNAARNYALAQMVFEPI